MTCMVEVFFFVEWIGVIMGDMCLIYHVVERGLFVFEVCINS